MEKFVRRHNRDGSHDSICTSCVSTVATVAKEWQLDALELVHVCDPGNIYRLSRGGVMPSPKSKRSESSE